MDFHLSEQWNNNAPSVHAVMKWRWGLNAKHLLKFLTEVLFHCASCPFARQELFELWQIFRWPIYRSTWTTTKLILHLIVRLPNQTKSKGQTRAGRGGMAHYTHTHSRTIYILFSQTSRIAPRPWWTLQKNDSRIVWWIFGIYNPTQFEVWHKQQTEGNGRQTDANTAEFCHRALCLVCLHGRWWRRRATTRYVCSEIRDVSILFTSDGVAPRII